MKQREWVPAASEAFVHNIASSTAAQPSASILARVQALADANREIHERQCFNLNPATNVMNPAAEALLASGIGTRPE